MRKLVSILLVVVTVCSLVIVPVHASSDKLSEQEVDLLSEPEDNEEETLGASTSAVAALDSARGTRLSTHVNWRESTYNEVNGMYQNRERFLMFVYRSTCYNSQARITVLNKWMSAYNINVYALNNDNHSVPYWVNRPGGGTLPFLVFVDRQKVSTFTAAESMRDAQLALEEYFGIIDDSVVDFSDIAKELNKLKKTDQATLDYFTKPTHSIPSGHSSIYNTAQEVVKEAGATTDYEKIKAIHAYVADNIAYDYASYYGEELGTVDALDIHQRYRRSICTGFANYSAALLRSIGIPTKVVTGFATGTNSNEYYSEIMRHYTQYLKDKDLKKFSTAVTPYSNHAWNESYADGRWVIFDTTWDCRKEYYGADRVMIYREPRRNHFDMDVYQFSTTHITWDPDNPVIIQNGWVKENGDWYYYKNNIKQTGWLLLNGVYYYMNSSGVMQTGWLQLGSIRYYLDSSGRMVTGTVTIDGKKHNFNSIGQWLGEVKAKEGWEKTSAGWVYYKNNVKQTGWLSLSGNYYYMSSSGIMQTGWQFIGGRYYYMNSSGIMQTRWLQLGNARYYLDSSGRMVTGTVIIAGVKHNFSSGGQWLGEIKAKEGWEKTSAGWVYYKNNVKQTGWLSLSGKYYYMNSSGIMQTGWLQLGSSWYYLDGSGRMVTGTVIIAGVKHNFSSGGQWQGAA